MSRWLHDFTEKEDAHLIAMLVERIQTGLQSCYDLSLPYEVRQFVCHDALLARHLSQCEPATTGKSADDDDDPLQETLFICQDENTLEFTVFLDHEVLHTASANTHTDDTGRVHGFALHSLDSLCTVVEGVSHAVCLLWHAHHDRQLRALDMELQAEVDKYLLLMACLPDNASRDSLHRRLFDDARITVPTDSELYERYRVASNTAALYCEWLRETFPAHPEQRALWQELARFYRLSGKAKFDYIRRLH